MENKNNKNPFSLSPAPIEEGYEVVGASSDSMENIKDILEQGEKELDDFDWYKGGISSAYSDNISCVWISAPSPGSRQSDYIKGINFKSKLLDITKEK